MTKPRPSTVQRRMFGVFIELFDTITWTVDANTTSHSFLISCTVELDMLDDELVGTAVPARDEGAGGGWCFVVGSGVLNE